MTDRTPELLVCVYYRVAAGDAPRVISAVREFQRTLASEAGAPAAELLLRFELPSTGSPGSPDDRPASAHHLPPPRDAGADATVMETYRLRLPAAGADAAARAFLGRLEAAAAPVAGLLRGARHVELFAPCAS